MKRYLILRHLGKALAASLLTSEVNKVGFTILKGVLSKNQILLNLASYIKDKFEAIPWEVILIEINNDVTLCRGNNSKQVQVSSYSLILAKLTSAYCIFFLPTTDMIKEIFL